MVMTVRKVLHLLTRRERQQALLLIPLVIVMALAEVAGIASIAPFLTLVADPDAAQTMPVLGWAYGAFGFESDRSFLVAVGIGVIVALIGASAVRATGTWILFRFGSIRSHTVGRRLLIRYLQQPYPFFLERNGAELANNVLQEVGQVINGVVLPGLQLAARAVAALAIVILLVTIDPILALLVTLVLGGAYVAIYLISRGYLRRIGRERVQANQARYRAASEAFGGIKDLLLLGRQAEMVQRFSRPSLAFARTQANSRILGTVPRQALEAVAFGSIVAFVLVLLSSGRPVIDVVPMVGLYAFAGYRLMPALQQIFAAATQIRYSQAALDEVHAMVRRVDATMADPDAFPDREAQPPLPFRDRLRFENVTFAYAGSETVLRDVTLDIPVRSHVAFVGPTGAGKTTLIDVLLGLLRPTAGRITVDGTTLDDANRPRWQARVGYVPQAIYLTDDTVTRNIALGLPDERIDGPAVRRAARLAQLDTFVEGELPHGYETVVGERGVRLSGGQRQRIGIARALYHDPDVLVFDEATSALDGTTEDAVYGAIDDLAGDKTIVTIAHRLATVREADRVFLLEHGRLVACGTYDELLRDSPTFRTMAREGRAQDGATAPFRRG